MRQKVLSDYCEDNRLFSEAGRKSAPSKGKPPMTPTPSAHDGDANPSSSLMEQILHPDNLVKAWKNVKRNRGAPGVDGMTVDEFPEWWTQHRMTIETKIRNGRYKPYPVKRVEIPKPGGDIRLLGIPTVLDRYIQQAVLQVLQPVIDPTFSEHSYGFRPGRSAHDAMHEVMTHAQDGYTWVVDMDLKKFFDRVNHDVLLSRVARFVEDKSVLRLIRRFLQSGIMVKGVRVSSDEGVPQGGPLSPLLANILLDDLDKELERRGHRFVRYADDFSIYVKSKRAAERVLESITLFLAVHLRLQVNREKSAIGRSWNRPFLGFTVYEYPDGWRFRISSGREARFRDRVRLIMMKWARGQSLDQTIQNLNRFLRGWFNYFGIADSPSPFRRLDGWIRRRLRDVLWRHWKKIKTRIRRLISLGAPRVMAIRTGKSSKGPWRTVRTRAVHKALGISFFENAGLFSMLQKWKENRGSS
jgi:RNA-directed DNA polymerase